jgi:hypothetical protein
VRRALLLLALLGSSGCAYYNGVYNAKRVGHSAERNWARGEYATAADSFRQSAAHAETVLVRFPRTRWRAEALFHAGRGAAYAGECAQARARLTEYLALSGEPAARADRARLASAWCLVQGGEYPAADTALGPLLTHPDLTLRRGAALFAARAALAVGDPDRAQALLAGIPGSAAAWETLDAAFAALDYAAAESLLAARARAGEWRSEVPRRLRTLWAAGRRAAVVDVALAYAGSRAPTNDRAQLLLLASDLTAGVGDTAVARRLALEAQRVGLTTRFEGPVAARLLGLRLQGVDGMAQLREVLARDTLLARGTPELTRTLRVVVLLELCLKRADRYGAGLFLAGEVARDSLRAHALAHTLFRQVELEHPESPIAARALVAAGALRPDSAAAYAARAVSTWPTAGVSARLRGVSPRDSSTQQGEDTALEQSWLVVTTQLGDSLRAWVRADSARRADSVAAAQRARGRGA